MRQRIVGRMFFGVGGARNDRSKEFESDPAYRTVFVTFIQGNELFRWGDSEFLIGTDSPEGVAILRILDAEAPWDKPPEYFDAFANHLVFSGELNGRTWQYSRVYPNPAIGRIVHSLRPMLERAPPTPRDNRE